MNQHYLELYRFYRQKSVSMFSRARILSSAARSPCRSSAMPASAGYEAGAKNFIVRWEDDKLSRLHYEYAKEEDLA